MTAESNYLAGLRTGFLDESHGIVDPSGGYPPDEPFMAGLRAGREAWRRCAGAVLVVDRPPLLPPSDQMYLLVKARSDRILKGTA